LLANCASPFKYASSDPIPYSLWLYVVGTSGSQHLAFAESDVASLSTWHVRPHTVTDVLVVLLSRFVERPGKGRVSKQPPAKEHVVGERAGRGEGKGLASVAVEGAQCVWLVMMGSEKERAGARAKVERGRPESQKAVREVSESMVTPVAGTPAK